MKRIISILLIITLTICGFAGCKKDETATSDSDATKLTAENQREENKPTESKNVEKSYVIKTTTGAKVGDVLEKPEVIADIDNIDDIYLRFIVYGDSDKSQEYELAFKTIDEESYLLYFTNGMLKNDELVYEVAADGTITKYWKNVFEEKFSTADGLTQETLKNEHDTTLSLAFGCGLGSPDLFFGNSQYRKCADSVNAFLSGSTYVYDVLDNGEVSGHLYVDKASGLWAKVTDADGNTVVLLEEAKYSGIEIPEYK